MLVYVMLFALFLSLSEDKSHFNMSNSLRAMIFCLIKLLEIYLGKWQKLSHKTFRRIFSHSRPQYFYIKNTALYCI